jgi:large subunit ribosomal protein L10
MDRNTKIEQVKDIVQHYNSFSYAIMINYSNLKASNIFELKKSLNAVKSSKLKVFKNSLHKIACQNMSLDFLNDFSKGQIAVIFSDDIVCVSKIFSSLQFLKKQETFVVMTDKKSNYGFLKLSQLMKESSDDSLKSSLLGMLNSPASSLLRVLSEPSARLARICSTKIK